MAMNHNLFTGQCESVGESHVSISLSAKAIVMPTHAGNAPIKRHHTPRKVKTESK